MAARHKARIRSATKARHKGRAVKSTGGGHKARDGIAAWQKVTALIPLALVVGAWTASLGSGNTAAANLGGTRPGIPAVPTTAFGFPASFTTPTVHKAPSLTAQHGHRGLSVASVDANGIPSTALVAYQRAEAVLRKADPSCHLSWALVAAIGRVESDHGRFGGSVLLSDGTSVPGIYGPQLDGSHGTMVVKDTDNGAVDRDSAYDRAVGAMQFIPTTWRVVGVDGDGDGVRDPQDIDDSSLATAVYLCAGSQDLSAASGQRAAVFGYNHSSAYVALVLSTMHTYLDGHYALVADDIPVGIVPPATAPGTGSSSHLSLRSPAKRSSMSSLMADGPRSTEADPRPNTPSGGDPTSGGAGSATPISTVPGTVTPSTSTTTTPSATVPSTAPPTLTPTTTSSTFGVTLTPTAPTTMPSTGSPTVTSTAPTTTGPTATGWTTTGPTTTAPTTTAPTTTAPTTTTPTTTAPTTTAPTTVSPAMTPTSATITTTDPITWVVRPMMTKTGRIVSARQACVAALTDAQLGSGTLRLGKCTEAYRSGQQQAVDIFFAALPGRQGYEPPAQLTLLRVRH